MTVPAETRSAGETEPLSPPHRLTILGAPRLESAPTWLAEHAAEIRRQVADHGAVLVRGLDIATAEAAGDALRVLLGELAEEKEPFASRTLHGDRIYSVSEWPPDAPLCLHHELSYAPRFPGLIGMVCLTAPAQGGQTQLAPAAAVLRDLPPDLVARFRTKGWELTRLHNDLIGIPWQQALLTDDKNAADDYFRQHGIDAYWGADGSLRTRRTMPAIITHPVTGEEVWFNQIAFLNEWTMDPAVREFLISDIGPGGLPFNTAYGDGSPIDPSDVETINEVYRAHTVSEPWRAGDVLLFDNIQMAHGRTEYVGERQVLVAFGELVEAESGAATDRAHRAHRAENAQ